MTSKVSSEMSIASRWNKMVEIWDGNKMFHRVQKGHETEIIRKSILDGGQDDNASEGEDSAQGVRPSILLRFLVSIPRTPIFCKHTSICYRDRVR